MVGDGVVELGSLFCLSVGLVGLELRLSVFVGYWLVVVSCGLTCACRLGGGKVDC